MLRGEIGEQPAVLRRTLRDVGARARTAAAAVRAADARFIVFAARGSSSNAALYGRYLTEIQNALPGSIATPSVVTMYRARPDWQSAAVVGISQSGETHDVLEVVAAAREMGAVTIGITNVADSPLARTAAYPIATPAGSETSVPATKTYTAQLLALALLSAGLGWRARSSTSGELSTDGVTPGALARVPDAAKRVLASESAIARMAGRLRDIERCVVIGRGVNRSSAFETALKIQETCYVSAQAYGAPDFLHGPLAVVERGFSVIALLAGGPAAESVVTALESARSAGARIAAITDGAIDEARLDSLAEDRVDLATGLPETLSPIAFAIAGQLLALHLALAKGLVPEAPRALSKVTVTR